MVLVQCGILRTQLGHRAIRDTSSESHRPFILAGPAAAPTAAAKRELSLTNTVGELDAGMVTAALAKDLNPAIDAHRRLMARWSCSMRLLRYLFVRTVSLRQRTERSNFDGYGLSMRRRANASSRRKCRFCEAPGWRFPNRAIVRHRTD